ncbi:hypothetical protein FOB63_001975 [Clavispora lusitaniae]|uniref:uncharacterized protein n=1 Tax=Clavispora lusitaniae TaxID=36911 RepID=UPI00202C5C6E|nr:hypothetical protein FOB63_001975 [Clavispora lusitaniae]
MSDIPKSIGVYNFGPEIGKGSFATVYKGVNTKTNQSVAIKSVVRSKLKSKKLIENLEIEISILKSMKHPHIVGLLDYTQTSTHFHLVMDYCSMGDLSYFIRRRDQLMKTHPVISSLLQRYPSPEGSHGLHQTLVIHFLKQLSSALEFLRSKSLVHRDIKPQNLLLCPPVHVKSDFVAGEYVGLWELPILKIADFGFARFLPSTSMAETLCGSPLYMAPEILRYEKYNAKADLWSVGAVFYEMTVGKPPFRAANHIELLKNIEKTHDKIKFPSSAQVPEPLKRLIRSLLKYNPTERMSFNEFFSDPLIVNDLESVDKPLDTSEMDENLFISEYISPIKASDRAQLTQAVAPLTTQEKEKTTKMEPPEESEHKSSTSSSSIPIGSQNSRDEQIKQIITKNSPDPNISTHSIQPRYSEQYPIASRNKDELILGRDYVVVEKRAVEVNAIADELARVGRGTFRRRSSAANHEREALIPRRNSQRSNSSEGSPRPVFDRRISVSISPSNALGKAISLASNRLFGNAPAAISEEVNQLSDSNKDESPVVFKPEFANNLLLNKLNLPVSQTILNSNGPNESDISESPSEDDKVLRQLESIATKSHAVNLFADVKFSQLIPSPPSSNGSDDDYFQHNNLLPPKIVKTISEEGVVLYVKTLSLLAKGMAIASDWWFAHYDKKESTGEQYLVEPFNIQSTIKINELVQWIREKFNECLEKAEFIKLRLQEAIASISKTEEASVHESSSAIDENDASLGASDRIVAEKLIFDRALEISRNAAVNELVKEDLKGCELAYSTAIWMLEALLDEGEKDEGRLDNEDRAMVEKFIVSIGNRLSVLKRKLDCI